MYMNHFRTGFVSDLWIKSGSEDGMVPEFVYDWLMIYILDKYNDF